MPIIVSTGSDLPLSLCILIEYRQSQLPPLSGGLDGKTAYLSCGEGEFPIQRLMQLSEVYEQAHGQRKRSLLDGVLIENCHNAEDILDSLIGKVPKICQEYNIKLLIIDRCVVYKTVR